MANLFADPSNWIDQYGDAPPPASWNGTAYVFIESNQNIVLQTAPESGDTVSFTMASADGVGIINVYYPSGTNVPTIGPFTVPTVVTLNAEQNMVLQVQPSTGCSSDTLTLTPTVVLSDDCTEIGRTTRLLVTAYNLNRPQVVRARRYAKRCFVCDFNGAIAPESLITAVRWDCSGPWAAYMSNARIITGQRKVAVDVEFNFAGWTGLLCTVTLDNGEAYNAEFSITVTDSPLYPRAQYNTANGPFVLTASV